MSLREQAINSAARRVTKLCGEYRRAALANPAAPATIVTYWSLHAAMRTFRMLRGPSPE